VCAGAPTAVDPTSLALHRSSPVIAPRRPLALVLAAIAVLALGCDRPAEERAAPAPVATASASASRATHVDTIAAPPGEDVAAIVGRELARARAEGRDLVVYVGASWCEPCQRFHHAAAAGELDATFPTLRLLEFDLDRDEPRLRAAGYTSKLIPLFAVPGPDGRASGAQIEGSIKGDGAVAQITPRLRALLGRAR
jgi:thiol:disulfide interchange protein